MSTTTGAENFAGSTLLAFLGHGTRRVELRRQTNGAVLLLVRDGEGPVMRSLMTLDRTMLGEFIRMLGQARDGTPTAGELARRRAG